jgi:cyanophycinase
MSAIEHAIQEAYAMTGKPKGKLIIIGGHEDKAGDREILTEVYKSAKRRSGKLAIVTVASQQPEEMAKEYTKIFKDLGVRDVRVLDLRTRDDAADEHVLSQLSGVGTIFFTGGDQLRITSQVGDSPVFRVMRDIYADGGTIVGTSAGAAAMPATMLVGGPGDKSTEISALSMAPGLALLPNVVIDSHFAERGRLGRLLGAVAQNPKNLGLGIDEDTAVIVSHGEQFEVIGSGGVTVVDGAGVSYSSLSEEHPAGVISIYDVKLHILSREDRFDLRERQPLNTTHASAAADGHAK